MNVRRSHLEVIKTKQLEFYRHIQRGRKLWNYIRLLKGADCDTDH